MAVGHVTVPVCPNCDAEERAIADIVHHHFYCFNCGATGQARLVIVFDKEGDTSGKSAA